MYEEGSVKSQVVLKSKQGIGHVQLDCKGINFRPLRNLDDDTVFNLLTKVSDGKLSLAEMGKECARIKKRRTIQQAFLSQLALSNWEEAKAKYPQYADTAAVDQFLALNFNKGIPQQFVDFCQRAVRQASGIAATPIANSFKKGTHVVCFLQGEPSQIGFAELLTSSEDAASSGIAMAFVDAREAKDSREEVCYYIQLIHK
jgi:hypothetical protein